MMFYDTCRLTNPVIKDDILGNFEVNAKKSIPYPFGVKTRVVDMMLSTSRKSSMFRPSSYEYYNKR